VGQAFNFNGSSSYVLVPSSPSIKPTGPFTVEAWVNYQGFASGQTGDAIVAKGQDVEGPIDWAMSIGSSKKFRVHLHMGSSWDQFDGATTLNTNTWYHVAMVYDGTNMLAYVNGALDGSQTVSGVLQATDNPLKIGAYSPVNGSQSKDWFYGRIDEVSIYDRALSSTEILSIYDAHGAGKCAYFAPFIVSQPTNQMVMAGSPAGFTVQAGGTATLLYQWLFNQTNLLSDATNSFLALTNVQISDAGSYSVVVTNVYGAVTSSPASLIVFTNITPTLSAVLSSSNGQFRFHINGVTGFNYTVQASTNLVDWISLMTNVSPFNFTDWNATNYQRRFYRSVYFP